MLLRPDGVGIMHLDSGEKQADYLHCCHCGKSHIVAAALNDLCSGKPVLGFCAKCNHPTCPTCTECVPQERQIENLEAGRDKLTPTPAFAAFPSNPLSGPHSIWTPE